MLERLLDFLFFAVVTLIISTLVFMIALILFNENQYQKIEIPYKISTEKSQGTLYPMVRLALNGRGFCSGTVIDKHFILTAAHCIDKFVGDEKTVVEIFDNQGNLITTAKPAGSAGRVDYGILIGDFSMFEYYPVDVHNQSFFVPERKYITCGYPMGQKQLTCTSFEPIRNEDFGILGRGALVPAMSGGAVVDLVTNKVVAVNTAVTRGGVIVTPTLGLYGAFNIEP